MNSRKTLIKAAICALLVLFASGCAGYSNAPESVSGEKMIPTSSNAAIKTVVLNVPGCV
jgi:hypothetical protein